MAEGDVASAIEASIIENVARLPATEMEQYSAFRKLHDEGRAVEEIAAFFGVTELNVRRVLRGCAQRPDPQALCRGRDRPGDRPRPHARDTCPAGGLAETLEQRDRSRAHGAACRRG